MSGHKHGSTWNVGFCRTADTTYSNSMQMDVCFLIHWQTTSRVKRPHLELYSCRDNNQTLTCVEQAHKTLQIINNASDVIMVGWSET